MWGSQSDEAALDAFGHEIADHLPGDAGKAAARTQAALDQAVSNALPTITPSECRNYFTAAGYEPE